MICDLDITTLWQDKVCYY